MTNSSEIPASDHGYLFHTSEPPAGTRFGRVTFLLLIIPPVFVFGFGVFIGVIESDLREGLVSLFCLLGTTLPLFFWMRSMDKAGLVSLRINGDGFELTRRGKVTLVTWRNLEDLRIHERPIFLDGNRFGNLWEVAGSVGGRPFFFFHWVPTGVEDDIFGSLLATMVKEKAAAMARDFEQGKTFKHKKLQANQLGITLKNKFIPWSELAKPMMVTGQLLLWCRGQAKPIVALPLRDNLVPAFFQVASRLATHELPQTGYGRLLMRKSLRNEWFYWISAAVIFGWPPYIILYTDGGPIIFWLVLLIPLSIYMVRRPTRSIEVYDHAITVQNNFKTRTCAYKQITDLQWIVNRVVYQGTGAAYPIQGYAFTRYKIKLYAKGKAPLKIVFKTANPEEFLNLLKERALAHAFVHYKQKLEQEGSIAWGRFARFTPDGLTCSKSLLGIIRLKTSVLPLDGQLRAEVMDEGIALNHPKAGDTWFKVRCDAHNFLPGYELLREKLESRGQHLPPMP